MNNLLAELIRRNYERVHRWRRVALVAVAAEVVRLEAVHESDTEVGLDKKNTEMEMSKPMIAKHPSHVQEGVILEGFIETRNCFNRI